MARHGIGCCGGLGPHGRGNIHDAPEGTAPKLAERVLTQPLAAEGKEKGKPPAVVNVSTGETRDKKSAGGTGHITLPYPSLLIRSHLCVVQRE
jgi:hypothetical protein